MILTEEKRKYMIGMAILELGVACVLAFFIIEKNGKLDPSFSHLFTVTIMLLIVMAFLELAVIHVIHEQPLTIPE